VDGSAQAWRRWRRSGAGQADRTGSRWRYGGLRRVTPTTRHASRLLNAPARLQGGDGANRKYPPMGLSSPAPGQLAELLVRRRPRSTRRARARGEEPTGDRLRTKPGTIDGQPRCPPQPPRKRHLTGECGCVQGLATGAGPAHVRCASRSTRSCARSWWACWRTSGALSRSARRCARASPPPRRRHALVSASAVFSPPATTGALSFGLGRTDGRAETYETNWSFPHRSAEDRNILDLQMSS